MLTTRITTAVFGLLLAAAAVLLWRGPHFTTSRTGAPSVRVACSSLVAVGWPSDTAELQDPDRLDVRSFHVVSGGRLTDPQVVGLFEECDERRDTYTALLFLLLLPITAAISVLAALTLGRRPAPAAR